MKRLHFAARNLRHPGRCCFSTSPRGGAPAFYYEQILLAESEIIFTLFNEMTQRLIEFQLLPVQFGV
jgi:hypothetical protein